MDTQSAGDERVWQRVARFLDRDTRAGLDRGSAEGFRDYFRHLVEVEPKRAAIEERRKQEQSMMPVGIVNNVTPEQLADLIAYLRSLE